MLGHEDTVSDLSLLLEPYFDVGTATSIADVFVITEMIRFDVMLLLLDEAPVESTDLARIRTMRRYQNVPILGCTSLLPKPHQARLQGIDVWVTRTALKATLLDTLQYVLD